MNLICKDKYDREVYRAHMSPTQDSYHIKVDGNEVMVLTALKTEPIASILHRLEGMEPQRVPCAMQRERKKTKVNEIRNEKLEMPITFEGNLYDADEVAFRNINGAITAFMAGVPVPEGFTWRSYDNQNIPMDLNTLVRLAGLFLAYRNAVYVWSWHLKDLIDVQEDPSLVDIHAGWPEA